MKTIDPIGPDINEEPEPQLEGHDVFRPELTMFMMKLANPGYSDEIVRLCGEADTSFDAMHTQFGEEEVEARPVWDGAQERSMIGFSPRIFPNSVAINLARTRELDNGIRKFYIPEAIGEFSSLRKAQVVHVQYEISEGNDLQHVWVVADSKGAPYKPWRVRKLDSFNPLGGMVQGWFRRGLRWHSPKMGQDVRLGSWFVLTGKPTRRTAQLEPARVITIAGNRYVVDAKSATYCGTDHNNGIASRSTDIEVFECSCDLTREPGWFIASTNFTRVFMGTANELRSFDEFQHLQAATAALEQKCCLCIHDGCTWPHYAASNPAIGYRGNPDCIGMSRLRAS